MKIQKHYRPELLVSKGKEPNPLLTDPYLDAKADRIVSTNGPAMVALPVETAKGERSRYLACSLLEAARKLGDPDVPAEIDDQEVVEYGVLWPTAQERTFVDWQQLVPKHRRGDPGTVTISLNARLLKLIADARGTGGAVRLTLQSDDAEAPILVEPCTADPEEFGLLMPLRDGGEVLPPGQQCPTCKRLLAAGAPCPEHGHPRGAERDELRDQVLDAAAALGRSAGPGGRVSVRVGDGPEHDLTSLAERRDAEKRAKLERGADAIPQNAGAGELTKKDTKGEAVARKKARRG